MEVGRSFDDMTEKEICVNNFFNEKLKEIAEYAFKNGVNIGMFCSLAFTCAEKQYLKTKMEYRLSEYKNSTTGNS